MDKKQKSITIFGKKIACKRHYIVIWVNYCVFLFMKITLELVKFT